MRKQQICVVEEGLGGDPPIPTAPLQLKHCFQSELGVRVSQCFQDYNDFQMLCLITGSLGCVQRGCVWNTSGTLGWHRAAGCGAGSDLGPRRTNFAVIEKVCLAPCSPLSQCICAISIGSHLRTQHCMWNVKVKLTQLRLSGRICFLILQDEWTILAWCVN